MIKKVLFVTAAFLCAAVSVFGQNQVLPNDPAVKTGKLDNGMTYYIRHNDKPAQRAEFYLATNIGAIQERPDQDGIAHFIEHMCFNGTKNFPGKGIINWLESIGASFGGNVNASTGVEQTIYLLNNIPLVRPTVVDSCILIMHDYSHFVTCDPEEIDKERGVILEERRTRRVASWRVHEKSLPIMYGDSKYAGCTIIGSEENLKTFRPESLTDFYKTWYRPDNQALIVVGDIDVNEVEAKIKSIFADIPAPVNPKAKDVITIADNQDPIVGLITDPEVGNTSFEVLWKSEAKPEEMNNTVAGLTSDLVQDVMSIIMNERFSDLTAKPEAPFISAGFGMGNICETMDVTYGETTVKEGKSLEAFETMLTEIEKMRRFGFTDDEVTRAKTELLSQYEAAAKSADTRKNAEFVMPMIQNFFDNYSYMDPATEYQVVQAVLQQLNAQIFNQVTSQIITRDNMVVVYTGPEREGISHPNKEQILAIIDKVENAEIAQVEGEKVPTEFLDPTKLENGKVVNTNKYFYDSELLTLSNGMKVVLLPNDNEKDKVSFNIVKKGGKSLISDKDIYSFESNIWGLYLQNTGIANFSATMVSKMLAGKQLSVNPYINSYTHGIKGESAKKDVETALQLAHLYFTAPRFNQDEYEQGLNQIRTVLPNLVNQPDYKLQKALYETIYDSPRRFLIDENVVAKASLSTIEKNYKKLFKDAGGATMVIVGDFDKNEIIPLVEKYLGSLKGGKSSNWNYPEDGIISSNKINDFKTAMETPKVTVVDIYRISAPYTAKAEVSCEALGYILNMIYTETLREEEGGTYGASALCEASYEPNPERLLQVAFETNSKSADKLRDLVTKGIKDIADKGPSAEQFDKAKKNLEKSIPENKVNNNYWRTSVINNFLYGTDSIADYDTAVENLTPAMVRAAAADLLYSGNHIELIMRPEAE